MIRLIERGEPVSEVASLFGLSRHTVYVWLNRYRAGGIGALENRSCRPHSVNRKYPLPTADL